MWPRLVEGLEGVAAIACGSAFTLAVDKRGVLWTWGASSCQGHPERENQLTPRAVAAFVEGGHLIKAVACGNFHAVCLTEAGRVFVFGLIGWRRDAAGQPPAERIVQRLPLELIHPLLGEERVVGVAAYSDDWTTRTGAVTSGRRLLLWGSHSADSERHEAEVEERPLPR